MTEAEFIEAALDETWNAGNSDMEARMPRLIAQANARIRRDLMMQSRQKVSVELVDDEGKFLMTDAAAEQIKAIILENYPCVLTYYEPNRFFSYPDYPNKRPRDGYTKVNNYIYLPINKGYDLWEAGENVVMAGDITSVASGYYTGTQVSAQRLTIIYYGGIEPVFDTSSGAADGFQYRHPDFYMAAVCHEIGKNSRDAETAGYYDTTYLKLREDVQHYEQSLIYNETGFDMPIPGVVC